MGHDGDVPGELHGPPDGGPARVVLGVGASRGCPADELAALADAALAEAGLTRGAVVAVSSADVKADEPAILALAAALGAPTRFLPARELSAVDVPTPSAVVASHVGTPSVAEAAALLVAADVAAGADVAGPARLLVTKRRSAHATCAVAVVPPGAAAAGSDVTSAAVARAADGTPVPSPVPTEVPLP